ncbi:trifunctional serine/threonine-protein kinase/ATP-binding protein/sensor histidine kinase [Nostoc sp.]|uniref:trifunctional serine/threonine-protein kinase/ATP-binding protein/sensor histidine kinase n=1 Tax=Nostoc sp. TaxID=1180 RepID=UPI002FF8CE15
MTAASSTPIIPGYQISSQLYAGSRTRVYRAIQEQETLAVVIKLLTSEYPSFNELLQFRNQYTISKNLNIPGIIRPLSLEAYGNGYILVMEDAGEISLREYIKTTTLSFSDFFKIAIQLTNILHNLQQNRVIHKDIKPTNILIHPQTKQVKLIDFSIASLLPKETQEIKSPNILEGTLAYISPEQTGRMNRGIDYRSDFYSLGVTFYELLTGELPFIFDEPMELVHCHIAKMPMALIEKRKEIPQVLSDIVMKLMHKNAEDRYQSALGLRYDLENCLYQLKQTGRIKSFEIGQRDVCDRFLIPEKLYGREIEVTTLLQAFERVANGSSEMMLVAGFSGVGKTAVVNEVHKPITRQQGYFIKGKFDQFNRNIPLSAFVQAFRDLVAQLLSESYTQLAAWQTKILAAVGENGQVIVEVIPELERIVGKQPPVPELSGSAAQNRFNLLFQKFIQVFTTKEHPLVMFLDDLQWADSASLNLLQLLMSEAGCGYLLILGAYRDNEVFPAHPLMLTLEQIQKVGVLVNTITLLPLGEMTVNQLVADTLSCSPELAQPLTRLVYQKTKGNPFFTTQFLKALYEDGWIQFQSELGSWQCDMTAVRQLALTDDVVKFMALQLQKLPTQTQAILKLAACIGNQFDLSTLAIVSERSESDVADALWKGLQEGFVLPQSEIYKFYLGQPSQDNNLALDVKKTVLTYKFLHDRVQQAAYSLIASDRQQATHLAIGRLLLQTKQAELDSNNIFEIVNHWNQAIDLIVAPLDRQQLASLNLIAGQKAKTSAAYEAALRYFTIGIDLLDPDCWQTQYDLALQLYTAGAEVALLNGNYQQMDALITAVLNQTKELLDQIKVYKVKIQARIVQNQQQDCLDIGLSVLQLLGVTLEQNLPRQVEEIEELIHLPEMKDPHKLAAADILIDVITPAWTLNPEIFQQTIFTLVNLSLDFGNCPASAFGYAWYGTLMCETLGDTDSGYQFGQLALKLLDKFNAKELKASVNVLFATHIGHWKDHTRTTLLFHLAGIQHGLSTGNLEYAGYGAAEYCQYLFLVGEPLAVVEEKCRWYLELIQKLQLEFHLLYLAPWQQGILNLQKDATTETTELVGNCYNERHHLPQIVNDNQLTLGFVNFFIKALLCYLFADYDRAIEYSNIALQNKAGVFGTYFIPTTFFYASLAILANYSNVNSVQQEQYRQQIVRNLSLLQDCAVSAPTNYRHKYELVKAEYCRVSEQKDEAIQLYDRAIAAAKENGYTQEQAIGNEIAAKFYLNWGKQKLAAEYMQQAYYCYTHWGANAKVTHLEQQYPQLLAAILQPPNLAITSEATIAQTMTKSITIASNGQNLWLDLPAVMKAAQAISQEIELDKLIATLMQIAIANAGAQIGHLVLLQAEKFLVVAKADCKQVETLEIPLEQYQEIPQSLIYAVARNQQTAVFANLSNSGQFAGDRYIIIYQPKSVLCTPISRQGKLIGILYLENNLTVGAFTGDRIEILQLLTSQAAISVENACLYQQIENYSHTLKAEVERKTQALNQKAQDLEQTLNKLQQTQAQLIHNEKMSSLGQMVAGVAHEINNPVNFIIGNLLHTASYIQDMMRLLTLYQQEYPQPSVAIQAIKEEIDLDFLFEDASQILESMKVGSERISQIVLSLRNFSRLDEAEIKAVDLHSGIESTLLILQHRLLKSENQSEVRVIKEYGNIPLVTCYPSQLNQVFLNIINNAIDAIRDNPQSSENPEIRIRTQVIDAERLRITIANTDSTIPVSLQHRIFEPFFTTKPVGRGKGLGLFVSYSIIQKHDGTLSARSHPTEGTEFEILLPIR